MKYIIAFCVIYYYYYCFLGFDEGNKTYPVGGGSYIKMLDKHILALFSTFEQSRIYHLLFLKHFCGCFSCYNAIVGLFLH